MLTEARACVPSIAVAGVPCSSSSRCLTCCHVLVAGSSRAACICAPRPAGSPRVRRACTQSRCTQPSVHIHVHVDVLGGEQARS